MVRFDLLQKRLDCHLQRRSLDRFPSFFKPGYAWIGPSRFMPFAALRLYGLGGSDADALPARCAAHAESGLESDDHPLPFDIVAAPT